MQIQVRDRERLDGPLLGALLIRTLYQRWPADFRIERTQALVGSRATLEELRSGVAIETVAAHWQGALADFLARRERYLLY